MGLEIDFLEEYQRQETERGTAQAKLCAPNGLVSNIRALYSDRHELGEITPAFHRPGTPLYVLPVFSKRVVAYLPPLPKRKLELLYGDTSFELFLALVKSERVIPVIGWPTDYKSDYCSYLKPIFERNAVSMPARGHALVHAACGSELFEQARKNERLVELAKSIVVQNRWLKEYPHITNSDNHVKKRVLEELVNNYVDLCIFGYSPLLEEILKIDNPIQRADYLLKASEILTYPSLIGMDGQAHFNVIREIDVAGLKAEQEPRIVNLPVVNAIIDGLDFDLENLKSNPDTYIKVMEELYAADVEEDLSRIHDEFVTSALEARDIDDDKLNEKAREFAQILSLAHQEIISRAADVSAISEKYKTRIAVGVAATVSGLATYFAQQYSGIGWQYVLLAGGAMWINKVLRGKKSSFL